MNKSFLFIFFVTLVAFNRCQSAREGGRYVAEARWLAEARVLAEKQLEKSYVQLAAHRLAVVLLVTEFNTSDPDSTLAIIGYYGADPCPWISVDGRRVSIAARWIGTIRLTLTHDRVVPGTSSAAVTKPPLSSPTPERKDGTWRRSRREHVNTLRDTLGELVLPNVAVLPVDEDTWVVPAMAGDRSKWHAAKTARYRLMGDWRLASMPEFARSMGHRYVMQLDDDSFIRSPVGQNLVKLFDERGYVLGARNINRDSILVTWGLPELARFFLMTHKIVPTTLFEFCDPPNIDGLYTPFKRNKLEEDLPPKDLDALERLGLSARGGWNRTILYGNCVMYSLEWRFRTDVHRFVQLCRATGGAFTYRWNEQGVIAMLWQMFVPKEQFVLFNFDYEHRYQCRTNTSNLTPPDDAENW